MTTLRHRPNTLGSRKHVLSIAPDAANRARHDFYKTPEVAIERLLDREKVEGPVWDPACGDGAFARVLERRGVRVRSTDLADYGYGEAGVDFLTCPPPRFGYGTIMTNPPFSLLRKFAERALILSPNVVFLGRLLWLEGKTRRKFFESSPLARVWVHSARVNVARNGDDWGDGGEGGMVAFAWYVWRRGHRGAPRLGWL